MRLVRLLPIFVFVGLAAAFFYGLSLDPKYIPSVMVGKKAPIFDLPAVTGLDQPGLSQADLKTGKVTLVNIWASWCVPCREENPLLMALSKRTDIAVVGINNKDKPEDAAKFLNNYGNPFSRIGSDVNGRATIEWGAYGVPESFIVDGKGLIRFKVIGGLGPAVADGTLDKEIEKAKTPQN
ncbi:MAG: DsbE family thiol:disulfide interchange protein [Alphaproteobacteria bacterium]|nr:DsbE family thiol:disulfide interchange protein [Alphaproteobacteria bacterium]